MKNKQILRISIFTLLVGVLLFGNVCAENLQASPFFTEGLKLTKKASSSTFSEIGEEITYTITVENASGYELSDISVEDDLINISCPSYAALNKPKSGGCDRTRYSGSITCTGTYTITEEDILAGEVVNIAYANAKYTISDCGGERELSPSASDSVTIKYDQPEAEISLRKSASSGVFVLIGDEITYKYEVTNLSDFPLTGPVVVTDDRIESVSCPTGNLGIGQRVTCTASYITTEEDYNASNVTNNAVASIDGAEATDSYTVRWVPPPTPDKNPELSLDMAANPSFYTRAGDLIKFTFTLRNSGDMLLGAPFSLTESLGLYELSCQDKAELALGEALTCTGWYSAKESDLNQAVENCATASGSFFYFYQQDISSSEVCLSAYYEAPKKKETKPEPDDPPPDDDDDTDVQD